MKLLKSVLLSSAVSAFSVVNPAEGTRCGVCPANGCNSEELWLECKDNICVCQADWMPIDGKDPGCQRFQSGGESTDMAMCNPIEPSAELCGKCDKRHGCGDETRMYCNSDVGMCVCHRGWGPNEGKTDCTVKLEHSDVLDIDMCKNVKPDVVQEKCSERKCEENERCKIVKVGEGKIEYKCVCKEGFEFDGKLRGCIPADSGKCTKNTQCDMENGERCDRGGKNRCVCRDGFKRVENADGSEGVCVATCGKFQTLPVQDMFDGNAKPAHEIDALDKIYQQAGFSSYYTYLMECNGGGPWWNTDGRTGGDDTDAIDLTFDVHNKLECLTKLRINVKPKVCDENATCSSVVINGQEIPMCTCNEGYVGDGLQCWSRERCEKMCNKKMPGSVCVRDRQDENNFTCKCPNGSRYMEYKGGQPCCVEVPQCDNREDCNHMGEGRAFCSEEGMCRCRNGLRMTKDHKCVPWRTPYNISYEEVNYEAEEDSRFLMENFWNGLDSFLEPPYFDYPCSTVRCGEHAHCEVDRMREPYCTCNEGYTGRNGRNCRIILEESRCRYGSCFMSERYADLLQLDYMPIPDFWVRPEMMCGWPELNLRCGFDGCCHCTNNYHDEDGKTWNGCEDKMNVCENGNNICHPLASCIMMDDIDITNGPRSGREAPTPVATQIFPPKHPWGYRCRCPPGMLGDGYGREGCHRPESEVIRRCESLKNPCGRYSECTDLKDGYECKCTGELVSETRDGKNCIKPTDIVDPTDNERCQGFCPFTKDTRGECFLRDLPVYTKKMDYSVMDGDATPHSNPGVIINVQTRHREWPLNRIAYSAFLEFDQAKCGNVFLGAVMSGDVKVAIFDRAGADGSSVYRVDGIQGYLTKTSTNSREWSGVVIQFTKTHGTLAEKTGVETDLEELQELKELKDGSFKLKPDRDTFNLMFSGKEVTMREMGDKFKSCFNVRDVSPPPFGMVLWDERTDGYEGADNITRREKLKKLDADYTKCYLFNKVNGKNIKNMVCKEPLVVNGEKEKDEPTFLEMVQQGDKDSMACTEKK